MSSQLKAMVDKLLTDVSSAYIPKTMICEMILPTVQVAQYSGLLGKWGTAHLRIENAVKGGRGKYRRVETRSTSTTQFLIEGHGLEGFVSKEDYANVEQPFDAERDESIGLSTVLWLEKEKLLADTLTSTAIMTQNTTLSGSSQFSDYNNSDPISVFNTAQAAIIAGCGAPADTAAMDILTFNKIKYHPAFLDALGYKQARPGGLKEAELAEVLNVKRLLVAQARYESAKEGQTSALLPVWGKDIVLAVCPEKAEQMQVSLGYMMRLSGSSPRKTYKQPNFNPPGSTSVLVEDEYDMLISNALAGYVIKAAIA